MPTRRSKNPDRAPQYDLCEFKSSPGTEARWYRRSAVRSLLKSFRMVPSLTPFAGQGPRGRTKSIVGDSRNCFVRLGGRRGKRDLLPEISSSRYSQSSLWKTDTLRHAHCCACSRPLLAQSVRASAGATNGGNRGCAKCYERLPTLSAPSRRRAGRVPLLR